MSEKSFQALGVLRASPGRAHRSPHHHWHLHRTARHVGHLGRLVGQLIHSQEQEITVLHVSNGAQPGHSCPDRDARQPQLRDRGIQDTLVTEFIRQAKGNGERAAPASLYANVLPDAEHTRVTLHLLSNRLAQCLSNTHLCHLMPLLPIRSHRKRVSTCRQAPAMGCAQRRPQPHRWLARSLCRWPPGSRQWPPLTP